MTNGRETENTALRGIFAHLNTNLDYGFILAFVTKNHKETSWKHSLWEETNPNMMNLQLFCLPQFSHRQQGLTSLVHTYHHL